MSSKWNPLIYILDKDERTVENRFFKKYKISRESDIIFLQDVYFFRFFSWYSKKEWFALFAVNLKLPVIGRYKGRVDGGF